MTDNAVHAAPKAAGWRQHRAGFIAATIAAVFMTVIGALGTGHADFGTRLGFWLTAMWTGAMIGSGVNMGVHAWGKLRRHPVIEVLLIALLIALPLTLAVIGAAMLLLEMERPALGDMVKFYSLVAFIGAIITGVTYGFAGQAAASIGTATPSEPLAAPLTEPPAAPRLADRLPHGMRGAAIIALEAEDHYLRVHLDDGRSALILLRLSDAIAELPERAGLQTHRSWWVARAAVQSFTRVDGRATLCLGPALEVPVSRSFYKTITAAGWLA